jgi:hypothetical protein
MVRVRPGLKTRPYDYLVTESSGPTTNSVVEAGLQSRLKFTH